MGSRKSAHHQKKKKEKHVQAIAEKKNSVFAKPAAGKKLEIVLKCDTSGCAEAIISSIDAIRIPDVRIDVISSGVGAINKSDIFMAQTGSRLILGFNVGIMPNVEQMISEHNVEIRIYDVIYRLLEDLEAIAGNLVAPESSEVIVGTAKVIALFKSCRKGIILGCEVMTGKLMLGHSFRVLGAMGPLYTGKIESLQIEKHAVREAIKGRQVGLKIRDFNKAKLGDLVEAFQPASGQYVKPWKPQGKIYYP